MTIKNKWLRLALLVLVLALAAYGYLHGAPAAQTPAQSAAPAAFTFAPEEGVPLDEDGVYTTAEDVALYLHTYGRLPSNFVTKATARKAGWDGGSLEPYFSGCCIGGDRFANREGLLPEAPDRVWFECDINTLGASSRGAERLVWSNDGLIYYTADHYESYTRLY